ncbi:MAG: hypothetical protein COC19_04060 [SAR86 cluster bacterium]|uniref:DUF3014 domain-containing protein n=1 Tax=SAR86 cluster bacterium TaxID=2030880 RepID=A0A2A4MQF0_9GAMM|nr:MAG: hypothetical protein COC19_04060 [SAR86 cluster bacterium]
MPKKSVLAIALVAVLTLFYLVYLALTYEVPQGTTTVILPTPAEPQADAQDLNEVRARIDFTPAPQPDPIELEVTPEVVEEPAVELPDEPPQEVVELPRLNDSDSFVVSYIEKMQNGLGVLKLFASDQLVRKFVVFTENVSRGEIPQTNLPYKPLQQAMAVSEIDSNLFQMQAASYNRFDELVTAMLAIETDQAVSLYRLLAPLFQQAYSEIGFSDVNFDDTLRRAIRTVLSSNTMEGPFQLVKPSVMYVFADAQLENLAAVNKQLLRLGPENTERLKAKLRQFALQL